MATKLRSIVSALLLGASLTTGSAHEVILDGTSFGRYNASIGTALDTMGMLDPFPCANSACGDATVSFAVAPDLSAAAAALGSWLTTPASPGGSWTAPQAIPAGWAINSETAIIYEIVAGSGLTDLSLSLGVDNGIFVWLDGEYLFGARSAGGAFLGEYMLSLPDLSAGTHYLQILREDHGGATGYAIELTGDMSTKVIEPATLALLGLGLAGFAASRRRRP